MLQIRFIKRQCFDADSQQNCEFIAEERNKNKNNFIHKPSWKCFSYEEIFIATNGFSPENVVGRGGYAEVYRGVLGDGQAIAVKMLTRATNDERKEKDFLTEIGTLGHVAVLIMDFISFSNSLSKRHLLLSLSYADEKLPVMGWAIRYKIAIGAARGLHYLHKTCPRRIIHRDINHLAPEYFMHGVVDEKTDVFAFGVFLLELITGKKPVDGSYQSLHSWAKPILKSGEIEKIVDPMLKGVYEISQLEGIAYAASLCIRASHIWRPTMSEVLEVISDREIDRKRWEMPEEEEEEEKGEIWIFGDLEQDSYDDISSSTSPPQSISITSLV
ncbi:hypothetical protein Leryth_012277 [Lithospermum erythrorhizon]|nr:hypothetical protein Leryth_012277 [Lithospermum erythrorhizon]